MRNLSESQEPIYAHLHDFHPAADHAHSRPVTLHPPHALKQEVHLVVAVAVDCKIPKGIAQLWVISPAQLRACRSERIEVNISLSKCGPGTYFLVIQFTVSSHSQSIMLCEVNWDP